MRVLGCLVMLAGALLGLSTSAQAADVNVTPTTLDQAFADAQAGDTLHLASGDYGTFTGALKPGEVTIVEQDGASASMAVDFRPAANITLDGLTVRGAHIADSRTKNITIRNSDFDGHSVVMRGDSLVNANILLDGNRHVNRDVCSGCYDGRITIPGRTSEPTGITIQNSYFAGGSMDGILNGGNSVRILNNEFTNLGQNVSGDIAHTDAIQLYGSYGTVVKGNYFHGSRASGTQVAVGIMCADECDREVIEDNVFDVHGSPYAVQLLSDDGSRIVHNTFVDYGTCDYGLRCGVIYLGNKSVDPPSQGTVLKDNIITRACLCAGSQWGLAEESHNLFTEAKLNGTGDELGKPVYVGGAAPSTREGFKLADGSPGKGTASDGLDRGARFGAVSEPPPPDPEPTPAQCADGVDNEGDGLTDLADPGCTDLSDNDETDPAPDPDAEPEAGATLFATATPSNPSAADGNAVELGVRFRASVDGQVSAIRFYKGAGNTGTHVGHLWTADGQQLAEVTFTDETASGWQEAELSTPVAITGGETYVASYLAANGGYAYDSWFFQEAHVSGLLTAPVAGGVFVYGGGFPTSTYRATNYWVDVVFSEGIVAEPPPPDPPTASYKYSPTKPTVRRAVTFEATGSSCQASPCSYVWEDDGPDGPDGDQWPLGTGEVLAFTFSGAGQKHVRLTVTDSQGRSDSTVQTVTVRR